MINYYWLKLHFDLLDDYKVGTLPDGLKWRFIQCLLVAGELQKGGFLPPLNQFAFRIRPMTPEALKKDLAHLASAELVELRIDENGNERWFVSNFQKRQSKKSAAERKRDQRKRERNANDTTESQRSHNGVTGTVTTRDTDKIRIDKKRIDIDEEQRGAMITALCQVARGGASDPKTLSKADDLLLIGATPEQIHAFGEWWTKHSGNKPYLPNLTTFWDEFINNKPPPNFVTKKNGKGDIDALLEVIRQGQRAGANVKQFHAMLTPEQKEQYGALNMKWGDVKRLTEKQTDALRFRLLEVAQ